MSAEKQPGFFEVSRRLWPYARQYARHFVVAIVATILLNFANLVRPQLLKVLTDDVLTGTSLDGKTQLLVHILAGLLGFTLIKGVFTYIQGITMTTACQGTIRNLREDVFAHVLRLPIWWHDRFRVGDVIVRFSDDLRVASEFLSGGITSASNEIIILITSVFWMVTKDWQLTVVGLVVTPLAGLVARRFSHKLQAASAQAQESMSDLSSMVQETVSGIRVVKAFSKEGHEGDRFSEQNEDSFRWTMRIAQYTATQSPIIEVLATGAISLVLWYCAVKIIAGQLTLGDLLAFWAYMLLATTPINRLPQTMTNIHRGTVALARVLEMRDAPAEEEPPKSGQPPLPELPPIQGRIEFRGIRFRYDAARNEVLNGLDLTIEPGEHVALVGRNGTGKSTLMALLSRFYPLQDGDILLDGHSIRGVSLASLRRQIGVVPQETQLFAGTIRSNIAYGKMGATNDEIVAAARAAGAHDMIMSLPAGYDTALGERGSGVSGGQRQRIAVARMLLENPPVVVLDEATSAMDPEAERALQDSLDAITQGRTVINIAHRLVASRRMHRIVVLDGGKISEQGTHDELMARGGIYRELYLSMFADAAETGAS